MFRLESNIFCRCDELSLLPLKNTDICKIFSCLDCPKTGVLLGYALISPIGFIYQY